MLQFSRDGRVGELYKLLKISLLRRMKRKLNCELKNIDHFLFCILKIINEGEIAGKFWNFKFLFLSLIIVK